MSVEGFLEYLILREGETEKKEQRREAEVERTTWLYVLQGGGVVDTKTSQTAPQTELGHMDAIHCSHSSLKQSISLNEWAQRAETHICSPLLYGMTAVWFLAQILPQDVELISQRDRRYVSTKHYSSSLQFILSFEQHETCSWSSNWVWNQFSSCNFHCSRLINNGEEVFELKVTCLENVR